MGIDADTIAVGHGLFEEGKLHLDGGDARAGDAGHNLLLHAGDLVVLVVGVVDFVLAALGVAGLEGGHALVDEPINRGCYVTPRLVRGARGCDDDRQGENRHDQDDEKSARPLNEVVCLDAKHCHRLPPDVLAHEGATLMKFLPISVTTSGPGEK